MKKQNIKTTLINLVLSLLFFGCNGVGTNDFGELAQGEVVEKLNDLIFSGIDSIDNVTDSSARVNWTLHEEDVTYTIFNVTSGTRVYIDNVNADTYQVNNLKPGQKYILRVRVLDEDGLYDANTHDVSFTTKSSPDTPSSVSFISPLGSPGIDTTPTIKVEGVKSGDTIKLFSDSSCTQEIASQVTSGSSVEITTSELALGTYTIFAQASKIAKSNCSSSYVTYEVMSCPTGYIPVGGNAVVGAADNFCVMQYEAKDDGSGKAISQAQTTPWANILIVDAYNECLALNSELTNTARENDANTDGTYSLISNPEWMAIARNIENVDSNWTEDSVGVGCLKRGNYLDNGSSDNCSVASGYNGDDPEFGSSRPNADTAQLTLSNGSVIWDFSGNVWEWVDWTLGDPLSYDMDSSDMATDSLDTSSGWKNIEAVDTFTVHFPSTSLKPESYIETSEGIGQYYFYSAAAGGSALRGGSWDDDQKTGIYALNLSVRSNNTSPYFGFRCVYRP